MVTQSFSIDIASFDRLLQGSGDSGMVLIDARNPLSSAAWRPEGPGVKTFLNVPADDFETNEEAALARIPDESPVYVMCARGMSSQFVTDVLRSHGRNAINVEGGMTAWSAFHRPVRLNNSIDSFAIHQVARPAKGCLSYVISANGEALVVDPSRHTNFYEDFAAQNGLRITAVADTHLHADHISGGSQLSRESGSGYHVGDEDARGSALQYNSMPKRFAIGDVTVTVLTLPVPGHTLGSTALLVNNRYLISGDTLLPEGVGRPDLGNKAHEWTQLLYESLSDVLGKLDPHTIVLPAHAASAAQFDGRGAIERNLGDLLRAAAIGDREAFVSGIEERVAQSKQPPAYAEIRKINLGEPAAEETKQQLEVGMNQCAVRR